mmetsp:Transcript_28187/g.70915  ORF Transcript_28187/g.70915 Transcript_28187/m.70915 type:complete len:232 (-) Transcript_28187:504-1199(-)
MPAGRSVLVDDVAHGLDDRLVGRVCRAELEEEEPVVHTEVEAGVGKEHTHHDSPAARAVGREPLEAAARELCSARDEARAHLAVLRPELIVGRQIDPALLANLVSEPAQRGLLCCVVVQSGHREPREVERARHMRVRRGQVVDEACLHARLELDEPGDEALEDEAKGEFGVRRVRPDEVEFNAVQLAAQELADAWLQVGEVDHRMRAVDGELRAEPRACACSPRFSPRGES